MELSIDAFAAICQRHTDRDRYPHALEVIDHVLIYQGDLVRRLALDPKASRGLMNEWGHALDHGPGVLVIRGAYHDLAVVDEMTVVFRRLLAAQPLDDASRADHFGNNERIWNSFQKSCHSDPRVFIAYYENPCLHLACRSWLGPFYQITAQVNNVKPGGQAQVPHCDYHLGFQPAENIEQFPGHAQQASRYLTLQGAVAHTEMTVDSGPTRFLPFSQRYFGSYLASGNQEFVQYFEENCVQLPLLHGDMVFFNPGLMHGAGANSTPRDRMANLLQISSCFGRAMEQIDRHAMIRRVFPALLDQQDAAVQERLIMTVADGYPFPTNLDRDPPLEGRAPQTDQDILRQALTEAWTLTKLDEALRTKAVSRQA